MADDRVIELTNRAKNPEVNFSVSRRDILSMLHDQLDNLEDVALWHTHPGGGVGPSRIDMQQRLPFLSHFVVTLSESDIVITWY